MSLSASGFYPRISVSLLGFTFNRKAVEFFGYDGGALLMQFVRCVGVRHRLEHCKRDVKAHFMCWQLLLMSVHGRYLW